MRYTLMNQEHEVLDFAIDPWSGHPRDILAGDGIAWAPLEMLVDGCDLARALDRFLRRRALYSAREDLSQILRATGARNSVELAFFSGGFSLSDQYWYRTDGSSLTWSSSNFFDNSWDPAFGEAVLRRDYDALAAASPVTPDVTLGGICRKAWVQTGQGPRLYKASCTGDDSEVYGEALVSRMLDRLVGRSGHVPYEPVVLDGEVYSTCPVMLGRNDELVRGAQLLATAGVDVGRLDAQTGRDDFERLASLYVRALEGYGVTAGRQVLAKHFVTATLALDADMHPGNFGLLRDVRTLKFRQAPLFDHGNGFMFMRDKFAMVSKAPDIADLMLALHFSYLGPAWDYSWYDLCSLDGFEDEIVESLSVMGSLPVGYAELMARLFVKQRNYVNHVAESSR